MTRQSISPGSAFARKLAFIVAAVVYFAAIAFALSVTPPANVGSERAVDITIGVIQLAFLALAVFYTAFLLWTRRAVECAHCLVLRCTWRSRVSFAGWRTQVNSRVICHEETNQGLCQCGIVKPDVVADLDHFCVRGYSVCHRRGALILSVAPIAVVLFS